MFLPWLMGKKNITCANLLKGAKNQIDTASFEAAIIGIFDSFIWPTMQRLRFFTHSTLYIVLTWKLQSQLVDDLDWACFCYQKISSDYKVLGGSHMKDTKIYLFHHKILMNLVWLHGSATWRCVSMIKILHALYVINMLVLLKPGIR